MFGKKHQTPTQKAREKGARVVDKLRSARPSRSSRRRIFSRSRSSDVGDAARRAAENVGESARHYARPAALVAVVAGAVAGAAAVAGILRRRRNELEFDPEAPLPNEDDDETVFSLR